MWVFALLPDSEKQFFFLSGWKAEQAIRLTLIDGFINSHIAVM